MKRTRSTKSSPDSSDTDAVVHKDKTLRRSPRLALKCQLLRIIECTEILDIILRHCSDAKTFATFSRLNKRFNEVAQNPSTLACAMNAFSIKRGSQKLGSDVWKDYSLLPNGKRHGSYTEEDIIIDGAAMTITLLKDCNYINGMLHGLYRSFGNVRIVCIYDHGKKHGLYSELNLQEGKRIKCTYSHGLCNGTFTEFLRNMIKRQCEYVYGRLTGVETIWFPDSLQHEFKTEYFRNMKHGTYERWNRHGIKVVHTMYKHNKYHGPHLTWHDNGQQCECSTYVDDKLDGVSEIFFENGKKLQSGTFRNGMLHGLLTVWNEQGTLIYENDYGA